MIKGSKVLSVCGLACMLFLAACSDQSSSGKTEKVAPAAAPAAPQVVVSEWQPRTVVMGTSFNEQPNGDSALWFIANGIQTSDNYEFWFGDKKIDALYVEVNKSGTVTIPKSFLAAPGKFPLYLLSKADNKKIELGTFEVTEK